MGGGNSEVSFSVSNFIFHTSDFLFPLIYHSLSLQVLGYHASKEPELGSDV